MISKTIAEIFLDPHKKSELSFQYGDNGELHCLTNSSGSCYKVENGAVNFTHSRNYTDNFGDQWTRFPRLQLDSYNGTGISRKRFLNALDKTPDELNGKLILDVGCGTGRFAEIALDAGAIVVLDYSSAAYVAAENLRFTKFFSS